MVGATLVAYLLAYEQFPDVTGVFGGRPSEPGPLLTTEAVTRTYGIDKLIPLLHSPLTLHALGREGFWPSTSGPKVVRRLDLKPLRQRNQEDHDVVARVSWVMPVASTARARRCTSRRKRMNANAAFLRLSSAACCCSPTHVGRGVVPGLSPSHGSKTRC